MRSTGTEPPAETDWAGIRPGEPVILHDKTEAPVSGVMDARTEDASVIWVQTSNGSGRRLIHKEDGYRLNRTANDTGGPARTG